MNRTLVLNANYKPLTIVNSRRAFIMTYSNDDIFPLLFYSESWRDGRGNQYQIPSIIGTNYYYQWVNDKAKYSKKNIFARDLHKCQYCGKDIHKSQLTLDHIIPKSKFNARQYDFRCNSFENVVTACKKCNYIKSDSTLKESGLSLIKIPRTVTVQQLIINKCKLQLYPIEWKVYLE